MRAPPCRAGEGSQQFSSVRGAAPNATIFFARQPTLPNPPLPRLQSEPSGRLTIWMSAGPGEWQRGRWLAASVRARCPWSCVAGLGAGLDMASSMRCSPACHPPHQKKHLSSTTIPTQTAHLRARSPSPKRAAPALRSGWSRCCPRCCAPAQTSRSNECSASGEDAAVHQER